MDTQLITKSGLDELGLYLDSLGGGLKFHADGSLSPAHSINVLHFDEDVFDSYGNNVRFYQNSAGQIIGQYQIRFTVDNVVYYAPGQRNDALEAQPPVTLSMAAKESEEILNGRGATALATQFRVDALDDLKSIKTDVLLPHTRLGHWETHAPVRVIPRITLDSAGHVVGRHALLWQFKGAKFEIPCDSHIGGPPEPPRLPEITVTGGKGAPNEVRVHLDEGEGYSDQERISLTCTSSGYRPFNFLWELKTVSNPVLGDVWSPLTTEDGSSTGKLTSYDSHLEIAGSAVHQSTQGRSVFVIENLDTDEGNNTGQIRCTVSNAYGSASAVVPAYAKDKTQHGIF